MAHCQLSNKVIKNDIHDPSPRRLNHEPAPFSQCACTLRCSVFRLTLFHSCHLRGHVKPSRSASHTLTQALLFFFVAAERKDQETLSTLSRRHGCGVAWRCAIPPGSPTTPPPCWTPSKTRKANQCQRLWRKKTVNSAGSFTKEIWLEQHFRAIHALTSPLERGRATWKPRHWLLRRPSCLQHFYGQLKIFTCCFLSMYCSCDRLSM